MANENESTQNDVTPHDDSGGISDAELIGMLGLGEDLAGGGDEGIDDFDSAEDEEDAGGDNDSEDEADDADDDDAEDSEENDDAESEEDGESDEEEADEEESEEEEEEPLPKSVKDLQKRVHTLTKRAKGAEEERESFKTEVSELKAKLEKAAPVILQPGPQDPMADLLTEEAVNERLSQMRTFRKWCLDNLEGGTLKDAKGEDVELDAKAVRQRLNRTDELINEHGPERINYLRLLHNVEADARKVYAALFDDKTEDSKIASSFLRTIPEIMRLPNFQLIIGDAIRGMRERLKEAEAAKGKKPGVKKEEEKAKPKKKAPRAISPAPAKSTTSKKANTSKAGRNFMATGSKHDLEAMVLASL